MNIYRSITTLPLKLFIECLIDKNFKALIISGQAVEVELLAAWSAIFQEYIEHLAGREGKRLMTMQVDITMLEGKLRVINILAESIAIIPDYITGEEPEIKELFARLNNLCQANFKFTKESMIDDVKRCLRRAASIKINLDLKRIDFEKLSKKEMEVAVVPTREYFAKNLIILSDFVKYKLEDTMTTFEYCERITRYSDYCKQLNDSHGRR